MMDFFSSTKPIQTGVYGVDGRGLAAGLEGRDNGRRSAYLRKRRSAHSGALVGGKSDAL